MFASFFHDGVLKLKTTFAFGRFHFKFEEVALEVADTDGAFRSSWIEVELDMFFLFHTNQLYGQTQSVTQTVNLNIVNCGHRGLLAFRDMFFCIKIFTSKFVLASNSKLGKSRTRS
jgi:hypothetical protein